MILIPEQVSILREEQRRLKEKLDGYQDYFGTVAVVGAATTGTSQVGDDITLDQYQMDLQKMREITDLLETGQYLINRPTEAVGIGTKFTVRFDFDDDDEEISEWMLVDNSYGAGVKNHFTSKSSDFGQAILGKKVGESFEYKIASTNATIKGQLLEIEKDPQAYIHFIREKKHQNRICAGEKKKIQEAIASKNQAAYEERKTLTPSQMELLREEADSLMKNKPLTPAEKSRLGNINHLLKNASLATLPADDTIGIGSNFSLLMFDGNETRIKRLEMINRAVSTELDSEYVERISPLGSQVFGLKNNDEFIVRSGNTYYTGIVFDIDNHAEQMKTNNATTYQKNRLGK